MRLRRRINHVFITKGPNSIKELGRSCSFHYLHIIWHGPLMFAVEAKIYGVSIINPALSLLMKQLVIGQRQKAPNFSAFHWSPHGNLVSIGQHFVTASVEHLPKRTETSLPNRTRLCGPCIAAIPGLNHFRNKLSSTVLIL